MKKILIAGLSRDVAGVEVLIKNYYAAIGKQVQFDFLIFNDSCAFMDYFIENKSAVHILKIKRFKKPIEAVRKLNGFFSSVKGMYDSIWFNGPSLQGAYLFKYAKKHGIEKRIMHAHNSRFTESGIKGHKDKIYHFLYKYTKAGNITDFWACSMKAGEFFYKKDVLKSDKFKVIPNAVDTEKYRFNPVVREKLREELGLGNSFVIGHVGRFDKQKNHDFLIDIFYEIKKINVDSKLVLIGNGGDFENIRRKADELDLSGSVLFLGVRSDVNELMCVMDVFVLPSLCEGLPVVGIEAQSSGLTCFFADTVTKETDVTGLVSYMSLSLPAGVWAERIAETKSVNEREVFADKVREAGYDIFKEAENLQELL